MHKPKTKQLKKLQKLPEMKLVFKYSHIDKKPIHSSEDAVKLLRKIFDKGSFELGEQAIILLLDDCDLPIGFHKLGKGSSCQVVYNEVDIFRVVHLSGAHGFIMAHNHPNGSRFPSEPDINSSFSLKAKARFMGIDYRDDIILTKKKYFSFAQENMFWE